MSCTSCGKVNEAGRKFCIECGEPLVIGCPKCGAPIPADAKFCGECGTRVAGAVTADSPVRRSALVPAVAIAERRLVSILFADLVGFTTLAEGRDAEDTRELPDPLLRALAGRDRPVRRARREVHRRRGDGRLGCAGRPRGRCRAGGPSRARARRRGPLARTGDRGPGRRPDRRGGGHARGDEPGAGRRGPRQHGLEAPVGRAARHRPRRRGDPAGSQQGDRVRGGRRADRSRARRARCPPGGRSGSWPRSVAGTGARRSRHRSSAATTSCAS